jgi:hypothetical protein
MMNPNMNMQGKIGFSGGPNPGGMNHNLTRLPGLPDGLNTELDPLDKMRRDISPKSDSGEIQTCFSNFHQHNDGSWGYDLMKISPFTGKISGCFEDRIEQRKW